ncbi:hypothetical protein [Mesorhizobium sp.]|uniref:hypothetical protein n=1 Tax=Mesorhizobium sp. TaxID=1871066 RepID=UPI0025BC3782|nr:hypothetical protein [Mesorhizobium sp.]
MAAAETINVSDDHGGSVAAYSQRWKGLAARGVNVRIVGKCQSACTVLLGYIPRSRICVTPAASFGFHLAHRTDMTAVLWMPMLPTSEAGSTRMAGLRHSSNG